MSVGLSPESAAFRTWLRTGEGSPLLIETVLPGRTNPSVKVPTPEATAFVREWRATRHPDQEDRAGRMLTALVIIDAGLLADPSFEPWEGALLADYAQAFGRVRADGESPGELWITRGPGYQNDPSEVWCRAYLLDSEQARPGAAP